MFDLVSEVMDTWQSNWIEKEDKCGTRAIICSTVLLNVFGCYWWTQRCNILNKDGCKAI